MDTAIREAILAIVTTDRERVIHSSAPVFYAEDEEQRNGWRFCSQRLPRNVHDLENGCLIM